jgi:hypothetical protein
MEEVVFLVWKHLIFADTERNCYKIRYVLNTSQVVQYLSTDITMLGYGWLLIFFHLHKI